MKPPPFDYHAATDVDEVLALLAEHGGDAKVLAGGQSLVPLLSLRLARPAQLLDINGVGGLSGITATDAGITVGAMTREREAERSALVAGRVPVLAEALPHIGHASIRNRGTIGGSIAHADASAELPAVALVTDAEMIVRSVRGERTIAAADFFDGHFTTTMADDELLTEVRFATGPVGAGWAFYEIARRHGDYALVGVAAMVDLDGDNVREARLSLLGVADRAVRATEAESALVGQRADADALAAAAAEAGRHVDPSSDLHASADVRRHLTSVAVRRALETATARAKGVS